ncbi:MAG: TlpA family protein disulfide reductase [Candidatus Binataceae bacterium]
MRQTPPTFVFLAAAFVSVTAFTGYAAAETGQPAPALVVQELSGQTFDLSALRGKVVVINFWATWCPPCREEMPALDAFYRRYHSQGLEMIGLAANRRHERSDVAKVMEAFSYPAGMLHDCKANGFSDPTELPVTYVVDGQGIVRAKLVPDETPVTEQSLAQAVLPLLAERTASHDPGLAH